MSTPEQDAERIQRQIRSIPVESIAPVVHSSEEDGRCRLVAGELCLVWSSEPENGNEIVVGWDDPLKLACIRRYVEAHPERVHDTLEAARRCIRSQLKS